MAKFDFVEAAASGYRYVWKERRALLPLAILPLGVKMGSYAGIYLMDIGDNVLRQGLVLLPAHLMEGFVVALAIRMAMFGERYDGLFTSGQKEIYSQERRRAIMAGVVTYLIIKLVVSLLAGGSMIAQAYETSTTLPKPTPSGEIYVTTLMVMIFGIWAFRFFWLYVPAAMGIPAGVFLVRIRGFMTSVYIAGFWMLCFVPMAVLLIAAAKMLMGVFPGPEAGIASPIYSMVMAIVQPVIELVIALTSSVGMAYAVRAIMSEPQRPPRSPR
ncbi:MAG: hypothetical protein WBK55_08775 [Alphaproteobacteria bacterium]